MPANVYHFVNRWHVPYPPEEVWDALSRPWDYPRWWGKVYLEADRIDGGGEPGVGAKVRLKTKGWLPYHLRWTVETTAVDKPRRMKLKAVGDLATDDSEWVLTPKDGGTEVILYWNPRADKTIVRLLSPLLKPVFKSNHYWAMDRGKEGIGPYIEQLRKARERRA